MKLTLSGEDHPVPNAGFGQHELRTLRISLYRPPELPKKAAKILRVRRMIPQLAEYA
jgi:hypothetical protein